MKKKPFELVPGPFGRADERASHEAFEEYMGGRSRADQLFRIYQNSYPMPTHQIGVTLSSEEVFQHKAKREGFSQEEIDALLLLQGA